ncbi:MAG: rane protease regulatory rane protein [Paenibacillus sp.]|jgi:membrane-bound ClpP family serine protease|nr:rane protease regulatory rane protein [Paenibacillus sp.]
MEAIYWACLSGGVIFAIVTVIFGDLISNAVDGVLDFLSVDGLPFLQPMVLVTIITVFGGAGLLLEHYTIIGAIFNAVLAFVLAVLIGLLVYLFYVRPMQNSENSTGYSIQDLTGKLGEVLVPIPAVGYGEVLVRTGAANTNQIAASYNGEMITSGSRVVVVEVKDDTVFVTRLD